MRTRGGRALPWLMMVLGAGSPVAGRAEPSPVIRMTREANKVMILAESTPIATYVFADPEIPRPYLCDVHTLSGTRVTRHLPPVPGVDKTDHATFHPGVWLAFGDISGADFWRNKARIRFDGFLHPPSGGPERGHLGVELIYEADGKELARELCQIAIRCRPHGYWILWDSTITSPRELVFGDQEEMGLGIRLATPLTVEAGGEMVNSLGDRDEKGVWGKQAEWLDARRLTDGRSVSVFFAPHAGNIRPSYFHARDYGMVTANMFGERAFTGQGDGSLRLEAKQPLRLRYGLFISEDHDEPASSLAEMNELFETSFIPGPEN